MNETALPAQGGEIRLCSFTNKEQNKKNERK